MAGLMIDRVSKRFGDFDALANVSIDVADGEFLAVRADRGGDRGLDVRAHGRGQYLPQSRPPRRLQAEFEQREVTAPVRLDPRGELLHEPRAWYTCLETGASLSLYSGLNTMTAIFSSYWALGWTYCVK